MDISLDDAILMIGAVMIIALVWVWHVESKTPFDLRKTIINKDGSVSLGKLGQAVALMVSTWVLIHETRAGVLSEWLFIGYMAAWAAANLTSKFIDTKETNKKLVKGPSK